MCIVLLLVREESFDLFFEKPGGGKRIFEKWISAGWKRLIQDEKDVKKEDENKQQLKKD